MITLKNTQETHQVKPPLGDWLGLRSQENV